MSDLRFEPISERWISIAQNRNDRPLDFKPIEQRVLDVVCPFCQGSEHETPTAWHAYDADGTKHKGDSGDSWLTRVVPNKYPSLTQQAPKSSGEKSTLKNGFADVDFDSSFYGRSSGAGIQDLIIPSPRHLISVSELTEAETKIAFVAYQDHLVLLSENPAIKHGMLFTNCRNAAGASLEHIHTQVIGVPMISSYLQGRASRNAAHYQQHSCSLIQSLTNWERDQGHRILEQTEHFTALCPYASQYAYQVWIVPKPTAGDFLNCSSAVRDELALFSQRLVKAIETLLEEPAYNMLFQIAPFGDDSVPAAEQPWYIEIIPRTTNAAGFELGTDVWVNPVAPETAAQSLKACLAQLTPVE